MSKTDKEPRTAIRNSKSPDPDLTRTRTISFPVLGVTLALLVTGTAGLYLWHGHQVRRSSAAFLEQAEQLVKAADEAGEESQYLDAAELLFRYTQLRPDDNDARIQLAEVYQKTAQDARQIERAVKLLHQALSMAEGEQKESLRRSLIELLLKQRRFYEAETEARKQTALNAPAKERPNFEANRLLALAIFGRFRTGEIPAREISQLTLTLVGALRNAVSVETDPQLAEILANLLRTENAQVVVYPPERGIGSVETTPGPMTRAGRYAEADSLMDELVRKCSDNATAWLIRSNYRQVHGLVGASEDLDQALRLGKDDVIVRLHAATQARRGALDLIDGLGLGLGALLDSTEEIKTDDQTETIRNARQLLQTALEHYSHVVENLDPQNEIAILGLGRMAIMLGDKKRAGDLWHQALNEDELSSFSIRYYLAQLRLSDRDFAAATPLIADLETDLAQNVLNADSGLIEQAERSVKLMKAKLLIGKEQYSAALPLLEQVSAGQPESTAQAAEHFEAFRLAGYYYEMVGSPDQAAQCFEAAAKVALARHEQASARRSAAIAWELAGAIDQAIINCRRSLEMHSDGETHLTLTHLLLKKQRMLPKADQNWGQFDRALSQLQKLEESGNLDAGWRVSLLESDARLARANSVGQIKEARASAFQVACQIEKDNRQDELLMRQLVFLYEKLQKPDDADRALEQFKDVTTDEIARHVVESNLEYERKDYDAARQCLQKLGSDLSRVNRVLVKKNEARVLQASGQLKQAADILESLAKDYPDNLSIARMRMQIVREMGDARAAEALETELLGGPQRNRSWATAMRIRRLIRGATASDESGFLEAVSLVSRLEAARPSWSVVYAIRGELEEKRASFADEETKQQTILAKAARLYERAIDLGERNMNVYERLVNTLYRVDRCDDAAAYLTQIENVVPISGKLSEIAINIAVRDEDRNKALDVARRAIESRPDDVMERVWYGLLLLSDERNEEAELALREVVRLAPEDARSWNGLFTFYTKTGNVEKAQETLSQMVAKAKIPEQKKSLVLAQGYEALGEDANAERAYREAAQKAPHDAETWMRMASFFVSGMLESKPGYREKAIGALNDIVRLGLDKDGRAKRTLATLMASEGGKAWQSALEMLENDTTSDVASATDRRLKGTLLFRRDGERNLAEARKIFEQLISSSEAETRDRLLLARILERQGDASGAREQYVHIAAKNPPDTDGLPSYVDFLLRQNDRNEAQRWFAVLEEAMAGTFSLDLLQLRGRLLVAQDRAAEVPRVLDALANDELASLPMGDMAAKSELMVQTGDLYTQLGLHNAAESWYRQLAQLDPSQIVPLATCLARQDRMKEAVDLCTEPSAEINSAQKVGLLSAAFTSGRPSPADYARAEPILSAAEKEHGGDSNLLMQLANIRIVQGRIEDAVRLLEKTVALDPRNVLALNNLAAMMSERPAMRDKALEYIDQALDITGPRPDLYDTKASILIYSNRAANAIRLLEFAVRTGKEDPRYKFHLAGAHFKLNDPGKAASYFQEAMDAGLKSQILTEADRLLLAEMQHELVERATPK